MGFRRDVAEISTRWRRNSNFDTFSLGQLILESVSRGAEYRMFFPVEMVLMVKALITFEGVGQILLPGFDHRFGWHATCSPRRSAGARRLVTGECRSC